MSFSEPNDQKLWMFANDVTSLNAYEIISKIGTGGFGSVFKARSLSDGMIVAIKMIRLQSESKDHPDQIPSFAQREIDILNHFSSYPNSSIAGLVHPPIHVPHQRCLYLVFKHYPYDLSALLLTDGLAIDQARFILFRLFTALNAMHSAHFIHRDIKPENILIGVNHEVVLTDFGLGRELSPSMTANVGTQSYRAPELLLGDTKYGPPVDIWALGCLMFAMMAGKPLYDGRSDSDQFDQICRIMGTPTAAEWPGLNALPNSPMLLVGRPIRRSLRQFLEDGLKDRVTPEYTDLMIRMLQWNPHRRITAKDALADSLFQGADEIGQRLPLLTAGETHQRKGASRLLWDDLIDGIGADIELPEYVPEVCVA
jgi:serine/threonine protein kinase